MNTCKNCIYRVYDDQWGYMKCTIYGHKVKDVYKYVDCESHEPKVYKKKGSNGNDSSER